MIFTTKSHCPRSLSPLAWRCRSNKWHTVFRNKVKIPLLIAVIKCSKLCSETTLLATLAVPLAILNILRRHLLSITRQTTEKLNSMLCLCICFRKDTTTLTLVDQLIVAAMGPPGGGRNEITPRFLRHFNIISIDSFSTETMKNIFAVIMDWHFNRGFEMQLKRFSRVSEGARLLTDRRISKMATKRSKG